MYKIAEQEITPEVISVTNSCDYNENSKLAKIVFRQMPAPWDLPQ